MIKLTRDIKRVAKRIWRDRNLGAHGWIEKDDGSYVTIEPEEEDGDDYLILLHVEEVDALGYPNSEAHDLMILDPDNAPWLEGKRT